MRVPAAVLLGIAALGAILFLPSVGVRFRS